MNAARVRIPVVLGLLLIFATSAAGQDGYRISSVTVSSGESPTTSGLAGTIQLSSDKGGFMDVTVQEETARFMLGHDFRKGRLTCNISGTVGHHTGAPFLSPYLRCAAAVAKIRNRSVSLSGLLWPAWFLYREPARWRNDGVANPEPFYHADFWMVGAAAGGFGVTQTYLNFLNEPTNWLSSMSYTHTLRKDLAVTGSGTWNTNAGRMMYYVGATWRPAT
jgi:hypothetical protein